MNWVEMSSRGQGDRMSLSRFPQSPTHVAEAGGQGCPSGHSGQLRSAGTSSRATEANSSPWDGEILHFPTAWALQSSADRAFLQWILECTRAGMKVHGLDQTELCSSSQEFPLLSSHGDRAGMFCPVWGPQRKRENEKAEVVPRLLRSPGWSVPGKCEHWKKASFPQGKSAMGSVSQSSGKWEVKPPRDDLAPVGNPKWHFQTLHRGFHSSAAKIPGSFPWLEWLSCQLDNN